MKMKKVWQIISVVLVIALSLGMTAFAEGEKKATFTLDNAENVNVGDTISISLALETTDKLNSVGVTDLKYNKKILEFVGFSENEVISEKAFLKTWMTNPMVVSLGFKDSIQFTKENGKICNLNFKVLKPGETTITVTGIAKNFSEIFEVSVVGGSVNVLGEVEEGTYDEPEEIDTAADRKKDVIALKINAGTAYAFGKTEAIDPDNSKVVPYLKNDRTLVPLRFVSETLGAEVKWETGWNYCYVVKGDKEIKITFNSADIEVNGQVVTYDAPVEVVQDRTMVPIRFISEELGYDVKWNQANQLVIITPADNPWIGERQAEKDVLEGILVTFLFNGIF